MISKNEATRQDVVVNSVDHQISSLANSAASPRQFETLLSSELDHDLIAWPRQYLETYLDSDATGRVPLDADQLQDVLEAAFDRDAALARAYLEELKGERGDMRKLLGGDRPAGLQSALKPMAPDARVEHAQTDSGTYRGRIIGETDKTLIQQITSHSAVVHRKDLLDVIPAVGESVRIGYSNDHAHVLQVKERSRTQELGR
jgi:hypothetical protein